MCNQIDKTQIGKKCSKMNPRLAFKTSYTLKSLGKLVTIG
jgi:hypothetical protein